MVAPVFGFSVGDFIAGGQILIETVKAFKEAGGASSKYASELSFLNSLKSTFDHLERFASSTSSPQSNDLLQDISKLLQDIREPWQEFRTFLDKYEPSLGASSSRSKVAKARRTIQYTLKDISGKVEKLRRQTENPLQAINSLLSLHVIQSLEVLPGQLLQPAQCAQLVEAITLGITTELDKQIRELKLAADEHNVKQDEQLQIVTTLRTQLEESITGVQSVLDKVKGPDSAASERHIEQLDASRTDHTRVDKLSEVLESRADELESAMKDQKQLMLALKSFLEDKTSRAEFGLNSSQESVQESENQNPWPSSTLSAGYFAALLLSSVLSSVAVTSIVTRKHHNPKGAGGPAFVPADHSLPGLGKLDRIQVQPSLIQGFDDMGLPPSAVQPMASTQIKPAWSTTETVISTAAKSKYTTSMTGSSWAQDFAGTQNAVRPPGGQKSRIEDYEPSGYYSASYARSEGLSKLNNPKYGVGYNKPQSYGVGYDDEPQSYGAGYSEPQKSYSAGYSEPQSCSASYYEPQSCSASYYEPQSCSASYYEPQKSYSAGYSEPQSCSANYYEPQKSYSAGYYEPQSYGGPGTAIPSAPDGGFVWDGFDVGGGGSSGSHPKKPSPPPHLPVTAAEDD
ncbi:uncharacterized protein K444DRAFT_120472 [Hyaloscypha bicolor E]|uniref:Fungal N-terminal domain-containing protein n=1 Tax=Hyaloscypha bicolor E TaxID=1095630 RepID=A0A2J6TU70_9HELO|nr:uncharacterized protein K444DRAFT_120472 [Hyaloscypha bicolor E]PMD66546.1 hypothetical protein K444DRAFT_120472 [Hyaloscypha bicolor E]